MTEQSGGDFLDRLWEAWGHWIKNERGGTSQARLAKMVAEKSGEGTRQEDVSRWLKAAGRPSYEEMPALADALGVRRDWLAFNEGPMVSAITTYPPADPLPTVARTPVKRKREES